MYASGSLVQTCDGAFWYTAGETGIALGRAAIAAVLAYVPDGSPPDAPQRKVLTTDEATYLKVHAQSLDNYRALVLARSALQVPCKVDLGRLVFVDPEKIVKVVDAQAAVAAWSAHRPDRQRLLDALCHHLGLNIDALGISGSTLMFSDLRDRHELDLVIYGAEASRNAWRRIGECIAAGVFEPIAGYSQRFRLLGIEIDPQFALKPADGSVLGGVCPIDSRMGEACTATVTCHRMGHFYPAVYETDCGPRLMSFRFGHRGLFPSGSMIRLPPLPIITFARSDGSTWEARLLRGEWLALAGNP
ncbi:hypothetical protein N8I74_07865 [Chitiniphilus purpureus]|uniref:Nucleotidyltransferase family protein n=1 Tax=Chitiniphilus purpureus TaxID=2981137 RepID=A0ABY6DRB6_9NEIS|nr:hypothetical protein [Chitiniphilus sp. CD1]UXY16920.1 hypothetical protein N8I74_07865 [Chitiniphilus sp. CD1]